MSTKITGEEILANLEAFVEHQDKDAREFTAKMFIQLYPDIVQAIAEAQRKHSDREWIEWLQQKLHWISGSHDWALYNDDLDAKLKEIADAEADFLV